MRTLINHDTSVQSREVVRVQSRVFSQRSETSRLAILCKCCPLQLEITKQETAVSSDPLLKVSRVG